MDALKLLPIPGEFPEEKVLALAGELGGHGALAISDAQVLDYPNVYCSDDIETLTGYAPSEIYGRNMRFLQVPYWGQDSDAGHASWRGSSSDFSSRPSTTKSSLSPDPSEDSSMTGYENSFSPANNSGEVYAETLEMQKSRNYLKQNLFLGMTAQTCMVNYHKNGTKMLIFMEIHPIWVDGLLFFAGFLRDVADWAIGVRSPMKAQISHAQTTSSRLETSQLQQQRSSTPPSLRTSHQNPAQTEGVHKSQTEKKPWSPASKHDHTHSAHEELSFSTQPTSLWVRFVAHTENLQFSPSLHRVLNTLGQQAITMSVLQQYMCDTSRDRFYCTLVQARLGISSTLVQCLSITSHSTFNNSDGSTNDATTQRDNQKGGNSEGTPMLVQTNVSPRPNGEILIQFRPALSRSNPSSTLAALSSPTSQQPPNTTRPSRPLLIRTHTDSRIHPLPAVPPIIDDSDDDLASPYAISYSHAEPPLNPLSLAPQAASQGVRRLRQRRRNRAVSPESCIDCGVTEAPEWRKGPSGKRELCNRCGLRYAKAKRTTEAHDKAMEAMAAEAEEVVTGEESSASPALPYLGLDRLKFEDDAE